MGQSLYASLGVAVSRDPNPGTIRTATVETIDNDYGVHEITQLLPIGETPIPSDRLGASEEPDPAPRPKPGTTLTFTTETADEHGQLELLILQ